MVWTCVEIKKEAVSEVFERLSETASVELEGIEPSSKRGINKLSTCLVIDLVFELMQAHDYQHQP